MYFTKGKEEGDASDVCFQLSRGSGEEWGFHYVILLGCKRLERFLEKRENYERDVCVALLIRRVPEMQNE